MLLTIGGIKGGSGKTTIATNLCQMRSAAGRKVLLVDADEQQSAFDWSLQRDENLDVTTPFATICLTGKAVYTNLLKMKADYDDIIIDTGGRDTTSQRASLSVSDKFLLPFKPSSVDIWTIGAVNRMLNECTNQSLKSYSFINQADFNGSDNQAAIDFLKEVEGVICLELCVGNRKSFRNAAAEGVGVFELNPKDEKACKEMQAIYDEMYA